MPFLTSFKLLCGMGLLAIFSSTISKSPALPLLTAHLGGGPATIGLISAVSAFTGVLCSLPAGMLSDRIGRRRMLLLAATVFASAPFLYLLVRHPWQLILVRLYHGLATAIFVPVAMALVADLFVADRGEKMGWFSTATLLGRFTAPATGGILLGLHAANPDTGFILLYLLCGAAGILVLTAAFLLPRLPESVRRGTSLPSEKHGLGTLLTNRPIMATCALEAAILFAYGIFETFLPGHGLAHGLTRTQIGLCLSSQVITIAVSKPMLGRFSDRHGRPPQILAGALAGALCIALFSLGRSFFPLLCCSVLFGLCMAVVTSASAAHIADLHQGNRQGSAMGILGSIMDLGHTGGPLAGGILAASMGYAASFAGAGLILLLAALLFMAFGRARKTGDYPSLEKE